MKNRRRKKKSFTGIFVLLLALVATLIGVFVLYHKYTSTSTTTTVKSQLTSQTSSQNKKKNSEQKPDSEQDTKVSWHKEENPLKIPILMYHAVHVMGPEETANANLIVDPTLFENQIKALKEDGYYFLSPEEALRVLSQNELPAKKVVWLTFDDSMIDFYNVAYPILKKYHAKATNNVITGLTENKSPINLTLAQMKEMKTSGMSFQDHAVHHPDLSVSDPSTQQFEMEDSKHYLDKNLKQDTIAIAYPSGRYTDTTLELAKKLHYKLGVTTNEGLASAANGLLSLNRVRILPTTTAQLLLDTIKE
ncbi:polysaccharide deacetylase family protein [Streptococcus didelphis]|uniref:polysaccharide deacetylase family protein n=1 Tax=Streptococcus didelphis TaxID=102886 RepID=UPI00035F69B2|nr:polysaccharide deacetylase family protein [Streptococcus didelphis]